MSGQWSIVIRGNGIVSLPTLILFKQKKIVSVENGGRQLETLVSLVNEHLEDKASTSEETDKPIDDKELNAKDEL